MVLLRPRVGRVGRPGLIGTAARTAVIAGVGSATVGAVNRRQSAKAQADYEQQQYAAQQQQEQMQEAARQAAAQYAQPAAAPAPAADNPLLAQLEQLGSLHSSGVLTDEEFAAAKAKLLSA